MSLPRFMSVDGEIVPSAQATVHFLSPAAKYGSSVFEGVRAYWNPHEEELYLFRLAEHLRRLRQSMKVMRFDQDYDEAWLTEVALSTIRANELRQDLHLRLSALLLGFGLYNSAGPVSLYCAALPSPDKTLADKSVSAGVSSWRRIDDASMPARVKCGANYQNSRLGLMEVEAGGYDKVIFLTPSGKVSEGAGECVFVVRDGEIITPPVTAGILESVTRDTVIRVAAESLGKTVLQRDVDRTELYIADEAFFAGTLAELCPITSVDGVKVGTGSVGEVTRAIWARFEAICRREVDDHPEWRTPVYGTR